MTDWQQPLVVALTQASGICIVHETVYENRFGFTEALREMGATHPGLPRVPRGRPRAGSASATSGTPPSSPARRSCKGAEITVPDLRGGFSHLIAALAAEGTSKVHGIDLIDRGYERFGDKLAALGAVVEPGLTSR